MKRPSLLWWPRKKMTLNTRKNFSSGTELSQTVLSRTVLIFIFLLPLLFAGCPAPERRLEKEGFTLVYRPQSEFESEIKGLRLDHPIEISKEQVTNHLLSLHYKELSLTGKRRYVFSPDDVLEITPLVTKALSRMKADAILYYEVDTLRGITTGNIFRAKGKIHWRFMTIKGTDFESSSSSGQRGSTWRLVPRGGQSFKQSKKFSVANPMKIGSFPIWTFQQSPNETFAPGPPENPQGLHPRKMLTALQLTAPQPIRTSSKNACSF